MLFALFKKCYFNKIRMFFQVILPYVISGPKSSLRLCPSLLKCSGAWRVLMLSMRNYNVRRLLVIDRSNRV
jgi:hypothetical protein